MPDASACVVCPTKVVAAIAVRAPASAARRREDAKFRDIVITPSSSVDPAFARLNQRVAEAPVNTSRSTIIRLQTLGHRAVTRLGKCPCVSGWETLVRWLRDSRRGDPD